jgi:hypothetical protein
MIIFLTFIGDILVNFGGFTSKGTSAELSFFDYSLLRKDKKLNSGKEWRKFDLIDNMPENIIDFTVTPISNSKYYPNTIISYHDFFNFYFFYIYIHITFHFTYIH